MRRTIRKKIFLIASNYFSNELVGYGFTHIPSSPGSHNIEVSFLQLELYGSIIEYFSIMQHSYELFL